jgi:hypothetical protein
MNKLALLLLIQIFLATTSKEIVASVNNDAHRNANDRVALVDRNLQAGTCVDSPLKFFFQNNAGKTKKKFCQKWVSKKPTRRCQFTGVSSHCLSTCTDCSEVIDSTLQFRVRIGGKWRKRRCGAVNNDPSLCEKNGLDQTCRQSCGNVIGNPTNSPIASPSKSPTNAPVALPVTPSPTKAPIASPTAPSGSVATGQACTQNADCASNVCDSATNICYASQECKAIKHTPGTEFDENHVILTFVGSGFTDLNDWQSQIQTTYNTFENYEFFKQDVGEFSAFYVNSLEDSFCNFGCYNIARLLCCTVSTARSIGNSCFPAGANVQTVVVHNSDTYGGAGYISSNMATTSTHPSASLVAVHELGHSLFVFYDEYSYISNTPSSAINCDSDSTCPKWNDMIDTYPSICSSSGCKSNNYRVSEPNSFMKALNYNVGPVLERYTCCTYYSLSGSIPPYCNKFLSIGMGLYNYCDARGYVPDPAAILAKSSSQTDNNTTRNNIQKSSITTPGGHFIFVTNPIKVVLSVSGALKSHSSIFRSKTAKQIKPTYQYQVESNYFISTSLYGEDREMATTTGTEMIEVRITFESGKSKIMYFSRFDLIAVPPSDSEEVTAIKATKTEIVIILDTIEGNGEVEFVEMDVV